MTTTKRYAVLLAPEFRLQATLRHSPSPQGEPIALLEIAGAKSRVTALNAAAAAQRVERGMTPTQALARCPALRLVNGNDRHERTAQEILLQVAETLSPYVESTSSGVVTVELPPERDFTEDLFIRRWIEPGQRLELEMRAGMAGTPDVALLAARTALPDFPAQVVRNIRAFLAPLPLELLPSTDELRNVLRSWGIRTLGQLIALPRAQVCARLGPDALVLWERAAGGRPRPLRLVKPREFFAEKADLENPVEMLQPLLFLLRRFLEQIAARLGNAYLVAGKLRLVLRFEKGEPYRRIFTLPRPTREVDLLFRMLHTHLENFTSASPIVGLELAAQPIRPPAEPLGLW